MGARALAPMGHVRMMAAAQPFLSGAISKTVNLPETATVEEIEDIYLQSWKLGLKATAVYRDNCKVGQPLSDGKSRVLEEGPGPRRRRRPSRRDRGRSRSRRLPPDPQAPAEVAPSRTTSFTVGGAEGYMTSGAHDDGELGEVFLKLGKQGSTLAGVMDAFSIAVRSACSTASRWRPTSRSSPTCPSSPPASPTTRRPDGEVDHGLHLPPPGPGLPRLRGPRQALGIYSAEERQRYLETGSYEPRRGGRQRRRSHRRPVDAPSVEPVETTDVELVETAAEHRGDRRPGSRSQAPAKEAHTSAELLEKITGTAVDSPLCMTCGTKMRPAGSCYVCEGCGSTSGCS